jgi:hypothetical protein
MSRASCSNWNPSVGFFRLKETEMLRPQFPHNSRAFYSLINDRAYPAQRVRSSAIFVQS